MNVSLTHETYELDGIGETTATAMVLLVELLRRRMQAHFQQLMLPAVDEEMENVVAAGCVLLGDCIRRHRADEHAHAIVLSISIHLA